MNSSADSGDAGGARQIPSQTARSCSTRCCGWSGPRTSCTGTSGRCRLSHAKVLLSLVVMSSFQLLSLAS
eukprot:5925692-Pyramimonas_sp.AAC.1